jgi:hypothetical protein
MSDDDEAEEVRPYMLAKTDERLSQVLVNHCGYKQYRVTRMGTGQKIELLCDWVESQDNSEVPE